MARGGTASRVLTLTLVAVLLAAATQPGGIRAWFAAKFLNREAVSARGR